ncbi:MAG: 4-hydroxyphenylacetate decarboxylase small subunit [Bacteroidales bacterium]|nr:4-hydroxyphenylacetate decarboxylase small subunit [Candidatus Colimorpha onthohippi]
MKHIDCQNYIYLDCEKGMCALSKTIVPIDGNGSEACSRFVRAPKCSCCVHFSNPDSHNLGTCSGFEKPDWVYGSCGAETCEHFKMNK